MVLPRYTGPEAAEGMDCKEPTDDLLSQEVFKPHV